MRAMAAGLRAWMAANSASEICAGRPEAAMAVSLAASVQGRAAWTGVGAAILYAVAIIAFPAPRSRLACTDLPVPLPAAD